MNVRRYTAKMYEISHFGGDVDQLIRLTGFASFT